MSIKEKLENLSTKHLGADLKTMRNHAVGYLCGALMGAVCTNLYMEKHTIPNAVSEAAEMADVYSVTLYEGENRGLRPDSLSVWLHFGSADYKICRDRNITLGESPVWYDTGCATTPDMFDPEYRELLSDTGWDD